MSAICYFHICVFRCFSDVCGYLALVGKCSAFCLGISICEFLVWFCLGFGIFHGWNYFVGCYR